MATNAEHAQKDADMLLRQIYHVDPQNEQKITDSPVRNQNFPAGAILFGIWSLCDDAEIHVLIISAVMLLPSNE